LARCGVPAGVKDNKINIRVAILAVRYLFSEGVSAVDSKPASDGRIKTSHFFRLNPAEMFWQGMI
jgi:hypothetical protein